MGRGSKSFIVYMATNTVNGKRYIGMTKQTLDVRRMQHFYATRAKRNGCRIFSAAIAKYGEGVFEWKILATLNSFDAVLAEEVRLIAKLKPEYNISAGGEGVVAVRTPEWIANMSAGLKGRVGSKAWLGKHHSQQTKNKISATKKKMNADVIYRGGLTQARLRQLLLYDRHTGEFRWRRGINHVGVLAVAGNLQKNGYVRIKIDGRKYLAHRLAWFYVHGVWVNLRHQNSVRSDNRLVNLICLSCEALAA